MAFLIPAHRSTLSFPHFCRCSRSVDNNWIPVLLWYCEMKKSSTRFWHYVHVRFSWRVAEKVSSSLSNFTSSIQCLTIFTNVIELLLHFVGLVAKQTNRPYATKSMKYSTFCMKPTQEQLLMDSDCFPVLDGRPFRLMTKVNDSLARWKVSFKLLSFCFSWYLDLSCLT